jgi:hypothetical protein
MNLRFHLILAAALGLLAAPVLRADGFGPSTDLAVYLSPDATTPVFQRLKPDDTRLANAKPILDLAKAAEGWETLDLPGPFPGFVPTDKSRQDLSVTPGTPVHTTADDASPVLGNAPASPALILTSTDVAWSQVNFPGPVTVYFIKPAPAPAASAPTPVPPVAAIPTPAPAPAAVPTPAQPSAPATVTPPASVPPPATVTAITPVTAVTPPVAVTAIPAPPKPAESPGLPHFYYGTLRLRTDTKIGGPINAQYVLYSDKGQVIYLADLSDVVLAGPVVALLDKPVKIYGTVYNGLSGPTPIIHVLTLQTN